MKYLLQLTIILLISLCGEMLNHLIPLPIPAGIYGMVILFFALKTGLLKVESVKAVSSFLIEIMPVMFIPATVALMDSFGLLLPSLHAYALITVVSTFAVMIVSGRVAQAVIRRRKEDSRHA